MPSRLAAPIAVALVWAGMVLGISFLEAWVKFRAPSLSLEEGLDVGRHVFGAFNLVELALSAAALALVVVARSGRRMRVALLVAVAIVALQTLWLLPVLDERVGLILAGGSPPPAPYHVLYIALEAVKLAALLVAGVAGLRAPEGRRGPDRDQRREQQMPERIQMAEGPRREAPVAGGPSVRVLFGEEAAAADELGAAHIVVPPGGGMPEHDHGDAEAVIVPLSGRVVLEGEGGRVELERGALGVVAVGERVRLHNPADEPAELLALFAPGGFVDTFARWPLAQGAAATSRP